MLLLFFFKTIKHFIILQIRNYLLFLKKIRLKNKTPSVISSNCNGTFIQHDLGLQFRTPFVNLWIKPKDYLKILNNLRYYLSCNLTFTKENGINYPVGVLDDVKLYFQHYSSEKEAEEKWKRRITRIDYNNIFILFTDRDGCTKNDLEEFDKLHYKNKIVFTHIPYPDIKSAFYIKGFEEKESVGILSNYRNCLKRYYDDFDYVNFFNSQT